MMGAAVAAAMGGCMTTDAEDPKPCRKTSAAAGRLPARNRHPYKDVDWATALQIRGIDKPGTAGGPRELVHAFMRVKAYALDGSGEELFSQPYMLM